MRYSVSNTTLEQLEAAGAINVKIAPHSGLVFAELDDEALAKLRAIPGVKIRPVGKITTEITVPIEIVAPPAPSLMIEPTYSGGQLGLSSGFYNLRNAFDPPLTGRGATIAVLDSGIRETHEGLVGKVIYEANFSDSPDCSDVFSHGTGVAYLIVGGTPGPGEEQGICPGGYVMNIKMLNDSGEGDEEMATLAIEHVMDLREQAIAAGLDHTDPMFPTGMNASWGMVDTADPDEPVRVALRAANEMGLVCIASAGNGGPEAGTITSPACEGLPAVVAIGCCTLSPFEITQYSSRGPTPEGRIKPDLVFFGHKILTASGRGDSEYETKSGTSFACAAAAGAINLAAELLERITGQPALATQESTDVMIEELSQYGVKPAGIPVDKDNIYGYGIPAADLILQRLSGGIGIDIGSIFQMIIPMMMIGVMAKMMK